MHIIFCRNVLIYFNAETIQAVARRLYETLAPGGWLLTAASDPPLAGHARFETVTTDAGVLYRRGAGGVRTGSERCSRRFDRGRPGRRAPVAAFRFRGTVRRSSACRHRSGPLASALLPLSPPPSTRPTRSPREIQWPKRGRRWPTATMRRRPS